MSAIPCQETLRQGLDRAAFVVLLLPSRLLLLARVSLQVLAVLHRYCAVSLYHPI
jgi:hypothetical protein